MCSDTESRDTAVRLNKAVRTLESLREELKTSSGNVAAVILLRSSGEVRCFAREVDSRGKLTFEFPPSVALEAGGPQQPCAFANSGGGQRLTLFCK